MEKINFNMQADNFPELVGITTERAMELKEIIRQHGKPAVTACTSASPKPTHLVQIFGAAIEACMPHISGPAEIAAIAWFFATCFEEQSIRMRIPMFDILSQIGR